MRQEQDPTQSIIPRDAITGDAGALLSLSPVTLSLSSSTCETDAPAPGGAGGDERQRPGEGRAQYLLEELVGRGGMGEVWSALQVSLGRKVAVKRLRPRNESAADLVLRQCEFRQEAMIAGLLEHPNVVPVHDLGVDEQGNPLMSMKLIEGDSWEALLKRDFPSMECEEFLARHLPVLLAMTQAVAFAHSRGIMHRDLKPSQVMVGDYGEVMLTDWGLALCFDAGAAATGNRIGTQALAPAGMPSPATASNPAGTPALMAPEQTLDDARGIGPWTDVYLLGGTLYFLLTGTFPHSARTAGAAVDQARAGAIEPPSVRCPGRTHPEGLVRICLHALEREPGRRHPDATAFLAALRDYLSGAENRARSRSLVEQARAAAEGGGYLELARALSLAEEAGRLWPDNPQASELRETCLAEQARIAIAEGDLLLARITIERIHSGERKDGLAQSLAQADAARERARRERRTLRLATHNPSSPVMFSGMTFVLDMLRVGNSSNRRMLG